jgi:predicted nicotinamide N-methyase
MMILTGENRTPTNACITSSILFASNLLQRPLPWTSCLFIPQRLLLQGPIQSLMNPTHRQLKVDVMLSCSIVHSCSFQGASNVFVGLPLGLCCEAGDSWSSSSDGSAPGWRCIAFQGNSLFFQESPSHARECTGTVVWDGALMLLDLFAPLARSFAGKNVVDLGCGTGIVGIALASIGARVWLTDIGVGVAIAQCNAAANAKVVSDHAGRLVSQELNWTSAEPSLCAFPPSSAVDVIIACEVVYNNEAFAPLLNVMTSLSSRSTFIYLVLRQRHGCDTAQFVQSARATFAVEELGLPSAWREKAGGCDAKGPLDQSAGLKHSLKLYTMRQLK